ncbi:MAG: hypothetical protein ACK53P_13355, partial [Pseudanabaena sp.]
EYFILYAIIISLYLLPSINTYSLLLRKKRQFGLSWRIFKSPKVKALLSKAFTFGLLKIRQLNPN